METYNFFIVENILREEISLDRNYFETFLDAQVEKSKKKERKKFDQNEISVRYRISDGLVYKSRLISSNRKKKKRFHRSRNLWIAFKIMNFNRIPIVRNILLHSPIKFSERIDLIHEDWTRISKCISDKHTHFCIH